MSTWLNSALQIAALAISASNVLGATHARCETQTAAAFSYELVQQQASELAQSDFKPVSTESTKGTESLDYDTYRQIRFRRERSIWRGEDLNFQLQVLPTGWLFKTPIEINLVDGGNVRPLVPDNGYFDVGPLAGKLPPDARIGFSGFRVNGPLNRPDLFDEIVVFQGASYFRALSRGQVYGLSGRGLALNVGKAEGEEFPLFRRFWIEKPQSGSSEIVIHALLDSPSVTGAYRFQVRPGAPTAMDVQATLYPRKELANVGIAPLTSMFLFSGVNRSRMNDFRPAVHDSDALAVVNGWGERLWRPLSNPRRLQTSDFMDQNPRGFGLIQRARAPAEFQDLEARYEDRPSSWIEPRESWGAGAVELFEIPSELAAWHGPGGNYWGHNAIIRTKAFATAAGLPPLPGAPPRGGLILSHDFVEAALLRRAGWEVHMVPSVSGSYEGCPPTLSDLIARDRRWAQGNLQHLRLLGVPGLPLLSRLHLAMGACSYLASPVWALTLLVGVVLALQATYATPTYFGNEVSLFPKWPVFDAEKALTLFVATILVVHLPKLLGAVWALRSRAERQRNGGGLRMVAGLLVESVFSTLIAPVLMLTQTSAVVSILLGRDAGWAPQRRISAGASIAEFFVGHRWHAAWGLAGAAVCWAISPAVLAWMSPIVLGLLLAAPIASVAAKPASAGVARLLATPEERQPPSLLTQHELDVSGGRAQI